jgi:hypothetical protein
VLLQHARLNQGTTTPTEQRCSIFGSSGVRGCVLVDLAIPEINDASELSNYTETRFGNDLKEIRKRVEILKKTVWPEFRESVIK